MAATTIQGLSESEVIERRKRGLGNNLRLATSRSYGDILRQNILTFINLILFVIGALLLAQGRIADAVTNTGLVFLNILISVYQETRAKRKLDQIALLTRPKATVIREGKEQTIDPAEIVVGDVLAARPGDQVVADGAVVDGRMEVDESLLTGESDLIPKKTGDALLSGSFCVTGSALYEAQKVGAQSFANQLTASARTFRTVKTPLQQDIDLVIRLLTGLAALLAVLLFVSIALYDTPAIRSIQMAAVITGFVPIGLSFLVVVSYAMGAVRIASQGALIQQSNSVESLSNVNVLCMDKTGTLTANQICYEAVYPLEIEADELKRLLGDYAASLTTPNRTSEAIAAALPGKARKTVGEVEFSSARKWSALTFDDDALQGVYVLGALEMLQPALEEYPPSPWHEEGEKPSEMGSSSGTAIDLNARVREWSDRGLRVVVFAHQPDANPHGDGEGEKNGEPQLPGGLIPLGLVCFSDTLRPEARQTLAGFAQAGVRLKVISGDNPQTVAALAKQAGLDGNVKLVSGMELAQMDDGQFEQAAEDATIFGRITPQQKEKLVEALRKRGNYVAMIGDGVNDVLSLKKSQLGIAMQSGSAATRSVADMILLNDSFGALPPAFLEGQRIVNGMQDVLRLFLTRALYNAWLIMAVSALRASFPYTPTHITILTLLTVGIPTLALAAWARPGKPSAGALRSVMHFILSSSLSIFVFGIVVYLVYFVNTYTEATTHAVTVAQMDAFKTYAGINFALPTQAAYAYELAGVVARSALTTFTILTGLLLIVFVEPPTRWFVGGDAYSGDKRPTILAGILLASFVVTLLIQPLRDFFELYLLSGRDYAILAALTVVWAVVQRYLWRANVVERFLGLKV